MDCGVFFFFFPAINKSIDLWLIGYPLLGLLRKLESGRFDLLLLLREKADRVTEKKPRAIALTSFGQWQGHHRTIAVAWFIKGLPVIGQGPGERHKTVQQVVNVGGGVVVDGKVVDEQVRPLHAGERETSNNYFLPNICRFFKDRLSLSLSPSLLICSRVSHLLRLLFVGELQILPYANWIFIACLRIA